MKKYFLLLLIFSGLFLFANESLAANHYVCQGASGNGLDWANAYGSLPATLVRGDIYYIADGSYGGYTFDDANSGTQYITIKKATASDHGTDVGWQAGYGDGQVVFNSILRFDTDYWAFDGQTRNEGNWFDGSAYGFQVAHNNQDQNIIIGPYGNGGNNVRISYVFVNAIFGNLPGNTIRRLAIDTDSYDSGATRTGLLFHRMYVHGSNNQWFLRTTNGAIVEYSASYGAQSNSANHGENFNLYYSGNNAIIRYNDIRQSFTLGYGGGTAIVAITYADGLQFYGNVVSDFSVGDGAIGYAGYYSSHNRVYNNIFANSVGYNAGTAWGSGTDNLVHNNLWINCPTVNIAGTHNYNGFSDSNSRGEANVQTNVPTSIFTDYNGGVFTLKAATSAGTPLASPFNSDMLANARGSDGVWDRGAYEYVSGTTPPPTAKKGDLNSDNKVDIIDLGILLSKWGPSAGSGQVADINLDGKVDIIDLGILLSNWG